MSTVLKSKPKAKHKQNPKRKKQLPPAQAEPKGRVLDLLEGKQLTPQEETKELRQRANERTLVNWYAVGWLTLIHLGVLAAPFYFSWQGVVALVVLHWITGGIGICLGFHRLLTHGSFQTYAPVRWTLALLGGLAGEGTATDWVSNHRQHHALSDKPGDPHSPRDGAWWSHIWWTAYTRESKAQATHYNRWAPDLERDPSMRIIGYLFLPSQFALAAILGGIGYAIGGQYMAASLVVWGIFVRLVAVLHSTWFVNSASHMWGYKNYETTDDSRNNWWVALITYGEGWHNNHHAYPRMAPHGHKWWEIDLTFRAIRLLQRCGLAWNVVDYRKKSDREHAPHGVKV